MKFNWGTGIFIFFVLFVGTAIGFMIFAFNQDINLVHDDYYQKGVDHTEHMDAVKRSAPFLNTITVQQVDKSMIISFPDNFKADQGTMQFYRPSSKKFDQNFNLNTSNKTQAVPIEQFEHGKYILKIEWKYKNELYYIEKDFFVN